MTYFIARRLTIGLVTVWGVVSAVFVVIRLAPGDQATVALGPDATAEQIEALRHSLGLDRSLLVQYVNYLGDVLTLDFGESYRYGRNHHLLVGAEEVFTIPGCEEPPTFHCVLDPSLAPGYLAWVVNDGRHAHVGVAGYAARFPDGLRRALERFGASAPGLSGVDRPDEVERRGGPIPVGGMLRRISCVDGLLVGDAAGAVSPLTAGGLDPCLRLSELAAAVLDEALRAGRPDALAHYDGAALRARFRRRLMLRRGLAQVRTPTMAATAFTLLRTPFGRAAAGRILFGD